MLLALPRSSMVLLIGASGSGKSTFARRCFQRTEVLSSDALRGWVCDNEADQSASRDAFEVLRLILEKRLRRGRLTVVDATNVLAWARADLLAIARRCGAPAVAIVFDLPLEACLAQNRARSGRSVGEDVIAKQSEDLRAALADVEKEGFARVYVLHSPDEAATTKIELEN